MERICIEPKCGRAAASRYGRYCTYHKGQQRRHGAAGQKAVTKADLKPYRSAIQARIRKNEGKPLWSQLEGRWKALRGTVTAILEEAGRGIPHVRHRRVAALEVAKLGNAVEPREVVETVLAMYLMQDAEPHRFKSDTAFRVQLVRRVRGLTVQNAKIWQQGGGGRPKRAYVEIPPRVATIIAAWLSDAFGAVGIHLAKLEERDRDTERERGQALFDALSDIS